MFVKCSDGLCTVRPGPVAKTKMNEWMNEQINEWFLVDFKLCEII